jgi:nucleoid-associated protein YgaU
MFLEAIATRRLLLAANGLKPEKAKIINLSSKKTILNNSIEVSFNPNTIKYDAKVNYCETTVPDAESMESFGGNHASTLDVDLLFDTTMTGKNVRTKYIDFLLELTKPISEHGDPPAPPHCKFLWGQFSQDHLGYEAIVTNLDVKYVWFLPNGRPVRAEVDLKLKLLTPDDSAQNPTSRSEARSVWRVIEGQTLDWIAYQEYGDAAAWRHIAQVNQLRNPRDLRPGMILKMVPLP